MPKLMNDFFPEYSSLRFFAYRPAMTWYASWFARLHSWVHEIPWLRRPLSFFGYLLLLTNWRDYFHHRQMAGTSSLFEVRFRQGGSLHLRLREDQVAFGTVFLQQDYRHPRLPMSTLRTIIDAGANIGCFSLWAARENPDAILYAIEPDPESYALYRRNLEAAKVRFHAVNLALAAHPGRTVIYQSPDCAAANSFFPEIASSSTRPLEVATTTLPALLTEWKLEKIDLLKIDIEGAEHEVLTACPDDVWARVRFLVMEYHRLPTKDPARLFSLLRDKGFQYDLRGLPDQGMVFAWR